MNENAAEGMHTFFRPCRDSRVYITNSPALRRRPITIAKKHLWPHRGSRRLTLRESYSHSSYPFNSWLSVSATELSSVSFEPNGAYETDGRRSPFSKKIRSRSTAAPRLTKKSPSSDAW